MTAFVLFGVKCRSLDEAREKTEAVVGASMTEHEGLHMGGIYFKLGGFEPILRLKNNVDLDDEEMECGGLSEPDFPSHRFLLYVNFIDEQPAAATALRKLEERPEIFEKLRVE